MTDRTALLALADRVEALKGPDREVDQEVVATLSLAPANYVHYEADRWLPDFTHGIRVLDLPEWRQPALTASVDAVIALIEEKLPGWHWEICADGCALVRRPDSPDRETRASDDFCCWEASSPAVGLIAAALRAIASQEGE